MKLNEAKSAVDWIRDTRPADLIIASLFLLPILLGTWSVFLNSVSYLDEEKGVKADLLLALLVVYILGALLMKWKEGEDSRLNRAKRHIRNRLQSRGNKSGSFQYIRQEVDASYTDDFLKKVIDKFPLEFRRVGIKGHKPGMAIVEEETEAQPDASGDA